MDRIRAFIASHCPARLVVEATIGYDWFALLAEKLVDRVVVANTSKLRVIAKRRSTSPSVPRVSDPR